MDVKAELKDLKQPAMVAAVAVGACFLARKLTGSSLGIESHNFAGATKAFGLTTLSGGAVAWYNKKKVK